MVKHWSFRTTIRCKGVVPVRRAVSCPPQSSIGSSSRESRSREKSPVGSKCKHYQRNCEFYASCCKKTYPCRHCHDEAEDHVFKSSKPDRVICISCRVWQPLQKDCSYCGIEFGKYVCKPCRLVESRPGKVQYHCDGCGICRVGERKDYFHCSKCNMCLPISMEGKHKCIENISRGNCPVCQDDIHTAREPSSIPPCLHLVHKSCYRELLTNEIYACPICQRDYGPKEPEISQILEEIVAEAPMQAPYNDLKVAITCKDCREQGLTDYHHAGLKCQFCNSYSTYRNNGPLYKYNDDNVLIEFCEWEGSELQREAVNPAYNFPGLPVFAGPTLPSMPGPGPDRGRYVGLVVEPEGSMNVTIRH